LEIDLPNNWSPRSYQRDLWRYLERGGLRADVCWHRRAGKDEVGLHWAAVSAIQKIGTYWHMLPEAAQARKAIWAAINPHTGIRRIDEAFPKAMRRRTVDDEMFIEFQNGSTWQVIGSDNFNSLVGSPPVGIVFSEWSLAKPEAWTYIRPILEENGGWALFIWTPRGRNHSTQAFESREKSEAWFTQKLAADKTGVFSREQLEKERNELIDEAGSKDEGEAKFRQEYLVDFDAAVPGAYYGSHITDAKEEDRITRVRYDPSLKVDTSWDLGIDDYTAIWYFQQVGREVRVIDYFETSGDGLQSIVREAIDGRKQLGAGKPYSYGRHYLPHDVQVRELGAGGKSRKQTLEGLGVSPINVGVATDPEDRINAVRQLLPICVFDEEACRVGLDRLRSYRKRWNRSTRSFVGPLHDENSHGSDAFGEFAVNRRALQLASKPVSPKPPSPTVSGPGGWLAR